MSLSIAIPLSQKQKFCFGQLVPFFCGNWNFFVSQFKQFELFFVSQFVLFFHSYFFQFVLSKKVRIEFDLFQQINKIMVILINMLTVEVETRCTRQCSIKPMPVAHSWSPWFTTDVVNPQFWIRYSGT